MQCCLRDYIGCFWTRTRFPLLIALRAREVNPAGAAMLQVKSGLAISLVAMSTMTHGALNVHAFDLHV